MVGFVTTNRLDRSLNIPLCAAQTELRANKRLVMGTFTLAQFQRLEIRSLTIKIGRVLTPGAVPFYSFTSYGLCSVGIYRGKGTCSPIVYTMINTDPTTVNPFQPCIISSPGLYTVLMLNNTTNIDLAVVASGVAKLYY